MCGIAGFIDFKKRTNNAGLFETTKKMTDSIVHRGPDDEGIWTDEQNGIALGFRRLAILDLSPTGAQPMKSDDGRFVIIFNGEIYNFLELREELEKKEYKFKGHSDTEVMLAAFAEWGIEPTLKKLNGMFAIALWDKQRRELILMRDRIGKKPLYYGLIGDTFFFGSELKTFRAHPKFETEVNRNSLALYLKFGYVPSPHSIYKNIFKVSPGKLIKIAPEKREISEQKTYWSVEDAAKAGIENQFETTETEILKELEDLLIDATKRRMISDVPLGAFLSGGIDSSIVVALMQSISPNKVKTFSIGFKQGEYNEAEHAKAVAEYLGTAHQELYVTPQETQAVIPNLGKIYDEPFSDSSQIPTLLVSELARQKVTVALSGDGGDEFFGGYGRYFRVNDLWNKLQKVPAPLRGILSSVACLGSSFAELVLPNEDTRRGSLGQKLNLLSELMPSAEPESLYTNFIATWQYPEKVIANSNKIKPDSFSGFSNTLNPIQLMMLWDAKQYLPDDILVKVDRASMAVSLEVRSPLLDYRVAEFAWRVPFNMKIKNGDGKYLLKELLYKYVPREIVERPKMGFDVPIDEWLRGSLKDWAENLIDEKRLKNEGFFNPAPITKKWLEHQSGKRNNQQSLWTILMFQAWLEQK